MYINKSHYTSIISSKACSTKCTHTQQSNFSLLNLHALCLPSHFPPSPYCLSASSVFSFNLAPTPHISRPRIHQTKLRPTCHDPWENWYCRVLQHGFVSSISSPHLMGKGKKKRKRKKILTNSHETEEDGSDDEPAQGAEETGLRGGEDGECGSCCCVR